MTNNITADEDATQHPTGEVPSTAIDWEQAQKGVRLLLDALGEDTANETLAETWRRRVPAAFETLTEGTRNSEKPTMQTFDADTDEFIVKTGIPLYSLCEHHLLPYHGTAHIGYRPDGAVVGLSKLSRYVRWQSRQLTLQEGLTRDIAQGLTKEISADAVVVELRATHLCEAMRGVEVASETVTRASVGELMDSEQERFEQSIANH